MLKISYFAAAAFVALAVASTASFSAPARASSFAAHVPPHSVVYMRWNGPALSRAYQQSRWRGIAQSTRLRGEILKILNNIFPLGASQGAVPALAKLALRHQGAVAVDLRKNLHDFYAPGASFLALRAGADTATALKLMRQVAAYYAPKDVNSNRTVIAYRAGAYAVLQESDWGKAKLFKARQGQPAFMPLLAQVSRGADVSFFMNVAAARRDAHPGPRVPARLTGAQIARQIIGVPSIHTIAVGFSFAGKDCRTNLDVTFLGKPKGWLGSVAQPTSENMLKFVPKNVADFVTTNVNLTGDLGAIMAAAKKRETLTNFEIAAVSLPYRFRRQYHMRLRHDLLTPLSGTWLVYQAPAAHGALQDPIFVHPLKSAEVFIADFGNLVNQINAQWRQSQLPLHIAAAHTATTRYYSIPLGMFSPTLAIAHKALFLAPTKAAALAAAKRGASRPGIGGNHIFSKLKKRLHVPPGVHAACSFARTKPLARALLAIFRQQIQPALQNAGVMHKGERSPKFNKLAPYLSPAAGASWFNASGYHVTWIGPMPATQLLMLPAWAAGPSGKMLPQLLDRKIVNSFRRSQAVRSASRLRNLGVAAIEYQDAHNKPLPGIAGLVASGLLSPGSLINPATHHTPLVIPPADAHNVTWIKKHLPGHDDFVYLGKGVQINKIANASAFALAYDPHRTPDGINCLYADGHVESDSAQTVKAAVAAVNRQRAKMGLPAIQPQGVSP